MYHFCAVFAHVAYRYSANHRLRGGHIHHYKSPLCNTLALNRGWAYTLNFTVLGRVREQPIPALAMCRTSLSSVLSGPTRCHACTVYNQPVSSPAYGPSLFVPARTPHCMLTLQCGVQPAHNCNLARTLSTPMTVLERLYVAQNLRKRTFSAKIRKSSFFVF